MRLRSFNPLALMNSISSPSIAWPDGKRFAFTVLDDTDRATLENVGPVYALLDELGLRTTKTCWPIGGDPNRGNCVGESCDDPEYLHWLQDLHAKGFELGWHGATWHSSLREETCAGLEKFARLFPGEPRTGANHTGQSESVYWAERRLSGWRSAIYRLITCDRHFNKYRGHVENDPHFWGDLCREKIRYFRNFVYRDINTLKACPWMPYHDPQRPYVNNWFAASDGNQMPVFNQCVSEKSQDRLEAEGGACIMYTHFAYGFVENGKVHPRFQQLMKRLAGKNGWFVPVSTLLDFLRKSPGPHEITDAQRRYLERKWLSEKLWIGTN